MAYSPEVKAKVRGDYVRGQSLAAAADKYQVPYATARNWKYAANKAGDDWDAQRAANRISASGIKALTAEIIEDFVLLFQSTINELKAAENIKPIQKAEALARLSDAYQKTVKAAGASNPELSSLAIAMDVLKHFSEFLRAKYPHQLEMFMEMLEPFGEELTRHYG